MRSPEDLLGLLIQMAGQQGLSEEDARDVASRAWIAVQKHMTQSNLSPAYIRTVLRNEIAREAMSERFSLSRALDDALRAERVATALPVWRLKLGGKLERVVGFAEDRGRSPSMTRQRTDALNNADAFLYSPQGLGGEPVRVFGGQDLVTALGRLLNFVGTPLPLSEAKRILTAVVSAAYRKERVDLPDHYEPSHSDDHSALELDDLRDCISRMNERYRGVFYLDLDSRAMDAAFEEGDLRRHDGDQVADRYSQSSSPEEFLEWWLEHQFEKPADLEALQTQRADETRLDSHEAAKYFETSPANIQRILSLSKSNVKECLKAKAGATGP